MHAGPLPDAHVQMLLEPELGGTRVTMIENLTHPLLNKLAGPPGTSPYRCATANRSAG